MLVTDAVATTLTKLGAPRYAETPRSGTFPHSGLDGGAGVATPDYLPLR
jgi:hypothetical protein